EERAHTATSEPVGEPILVAEGLGRKRTMEPFDLTLRAGEVVGLAGLLGSGRTETAKLIFGALRADSGKLKMDGKTVTRHAPRQSIRDGLAFCPEDRKAEGICGELSVRENIILGLQTKRGWLRLLSRSEQERLAA